MGFKDLHARQGKEARREIARKLRRGVGVDGRSLARKVIPNGRPLGFGNSALGVPGRWSRAPVRAFLDGFDITGGKLVQDQVFHTGRTNQVPRPYAGLSRRQLDRLAAGFVGEIASEGRREGVFL